MNKNEMRKDDRENKELAESIRALACAIETAAKEVREHFKLATKCDLKEMECRIMSKISEFITKQEEFNASQEQHIDEVVAAVGGVSADVADLNRIIKELQDSSGGVTPEDQARIDAIEAKGAALSAKLASASSALKALDAQHPPVVPTDTTNPAVNR